MTHIDCRQFMCNSHIAGRMLTGSNDQSYVFILEIYLVQTGGFIRIVDEIRSYRRVKRPWPSDDNDH